MTPEERDDIEGRYTRLRWLELQRRPVDGLFDAVHLKEINRRIFQDLPGIPGFESVTPGEYRPPVADGLDWQKNRSLSTVNGSFFVAYSRMDGAARARLDQVLADVEPDALRNLNTAAFAQRMGQLYAELDYVHPFQDGNSRTLRAFIGQLARRTGYEIDWEQFSRSETGRDLLYIARDLSVNEIARAHLQNPRTVMRIIGTLDRLQGHRTLPDLLRDAVRPSRAIAFEQLSEAEALAQYPELAPAYQTMHATPAYFASKLPGDRERQKAGIQAAVTHLQARLDAGEI